jgi:hypothetical protein
VAQSAAFETGYILPGMALVNVAEAQEDNRYHIEGHAEPKVVAAAGHF